MNRLLTLYLLISVGISTLTGCHPAFTGTTASRTGDGTGPKPDANQAQITAATPSSIVAGSGDFSLKLTGANFLPATTVLWDGNTSLATTYVSSTTLTAQVPAALIAKPVTVDIIPSPVQSLNFGINFNVTVPPVTGNNSFSLSKVTVAANDLQWDAGGQRFYLSIAGTNETNPDSIASLNPQNGVLSSFTPTSSEPFKLAVSTDGTYLYAGLNSLGFLRRYTLPTLQPDLSISLGSNDFGLFYAIDVQPEPGNPRSVAVSRGVATVSPREVGGVVIYDDAVARTRSIASAFGGPGPIDTLLWNANALSLYGINTESSGGGYFSMSVSSAGLELQGIYAPSVVGRALHFDATTGYLYSDSGAIIDPVANNVIGAFPTDTVQGGFNDTPVMVPDGKLNIAFFLGQPKYGYAQGYFVLEAFDLTRHTYLGGISLTGIAGTPSKIVRWGSNGIAILTGDAYGKGATQDGVYLISGNFVTSPAP